MIESINTLTELFKLILSGLNYAKDKIKSTEDKRIIRRIIQIQLSIEDILDNAKNQIEIIKKLKPDNAFKEIKGLLENQRYRIINLSRLMDDDISEHIFKLFEPDTRRKISSIIRIKEGALYNVIFKLDYLMGKRKELAKKEIFRRLDEQEMLLSELEKCSVKIAEFIRNNFNIKEIIRFI